MQHIFNIAIEIEDERIVQSIEKNVEDKAIKMIIDKLEGRMCTRSYGGRVIDYKPLEEMIGSRIDVILEENKDFILEKAAEKLADKLARSKAGKAILGKFEEV
jgi:hypothetical protein